jgi:hypothetical protein
MATNLSTSLVIMASGDVLAQSLENSKHAQRSSKDEDTNNSHPKRHILIRRETKESFNHKDGPDLRVQASTSAPTTIGTSSTTTSISTTTIRHDLQEALAFWNPFRTATMAAWSVCAYTPFYISLYKLYDKFLPKQTPLSVAARVGLSFICSIPVNAGFYIYGTTVHHTMQWVSINERVQSELERLGVKDRQSVEVPIDWEHLWETCRLKLETELPVTVKTSGAVWIPINFFNFTVVPSHLRPLSLMFFSVFWNCYLSLSQHKPVELPKEEGSNQ